jgi:hypothetical protein
MDQTLKARFEHERADDVGHGNLSTSDLASRLTGREAAIQQHSFSIAWPTQVTSLWVTTRYQPGPVQLVESLGPLLQASIASDNYQYATRLAGLRPQFYSRAGTRSRAKNPFGRVAPARRLAQSGESCALSHKAAHAINHHAAGFDSDVGTISLSSVLGSGEVSGRSGTRKRAYAETNGCRGTRRLRRPVGSRNTYDEEAMVTHLPASSGSAATSRLAIGVHP